MAYVGNPVDTQNTFQSLVGKRFNGDGSTTDFTLDIAPGSVLDIEVFVGNVRQDPNSAYTLSGTTLSFTGAPPSGTNNIYVVHQAKSVGTIDVPALGVSTASIQADAITEAKIADNAVESEHLNNNIISGQTALGATPADTDEFLVSDAGTLKRVDYSYIKAGGNTSRWFVKRTGAQAVSNNTKTKVQLNTEVIDSENNFDSSSNYRYTISEAGTYILGAQMYLTGQTNSTLFNGNIEIRKNNSAILTHSYNFNNNYPYEYTPNITCISDFSASDYIEVFVKIETSDGQNTTIFDTGDGTESNFFWGYKIIT
mgnify:CR=1 FL=1